MKTKTFAILLALLVLLGFSTARAYELPTPVTTRSGLNIISHQDTTFHVNQYGEGAGWLNIDIAPLLAKAGITLEDYKAVANRTVFAYQCDNAETAEDPYLADELCPLTAYTDNGTASNNYLWFGFTDDAQSIMGANCKTANCFLLYGSNEGQEGMDGVGYVENDTVGFYVGASGGSDIYKDRVGKPQYTKFYVIIGADAIEMTLNVEVYEEVEPPYDAPDAYTLQNIQIMGEVSITHTSEVSDNGWVHSNDYDNIINEAIQAAFDSLGVKGKDYSDCTFYWPSATNADTLTCEGRTTWDLAGWGITTDARLPLEGDTVTWTCAYNGDGALWFYHTNLFSQDSTTVVPATFYIGYHDYFLRVNLCLIIIPDRQVSDETVEAGREDVYLPVTANLNDWSLGTERNLQITWDELRALLQCADGEDPILMGLNRNGDGGLNKDYSTTSKPGFWLTADGLTTSYGDSSIVFFEDFKQCTIHNYGHMPGDDDPGTTYQGEVYYICASSGRYYTIRYRFDFLTEPVNPEIVGSEQIILPIDYDDNVSTASIDITSALAALGVIATEVPDSLGWATQVFGPLYSDENYDPDFGYGFNARGENVSFDETDPDERALFSVVYKPDSNQPAIAVELLNTPDEEENLRYDVHIALSLHNRYYDYHIIYVSRDLYDALVTAIAAPSANIRPADSRTYNLAGQRVSADYHGIVIRNGRKLLQ